MGRHVMFPLYELDSLSWKQKAIGILSLATGFNQIPLRHLALFSVYNYSTHSIACTGPSYS